MLRLGYFVLLLLGCTSSPSTISLQKLTPTTIFKSVEYVGNHDGDTFTVNLSTDIPPVFGRGITVRILGIDTAEMNGKAPCEAAMALKAKEATHKVLSNSIIDLENVKRDKYFRLLSDVTVHHKTLAVSFPLSAYLMNKGLAVPYDGGTKVKVDWCKGAVNGRKNK